MVLAVLSGGGRAAGGGGPVARHLRDARGRAGAVHDVAAASGVAWLPGTGWCHSRKPP